MDCYVFRTRGVNSDYLIRVRYYGYLVLRVTCYPKKYFADGATGEKRATQSSSGRPVEYKY
jgi:hypothetical protein